MASSLQTIARGATLGAVLLGTAGCAHHHVSMEDLVLPPRASGQTGVSAKPHTARKPRMDPRELLRGEAKERAGSPHQD